MASLSHLFWLVLAYWIISVFIGIYAGKYVHSAKDFAVAGHSLPFYMVTATVFATWFGSEAVLGIPSTFLKEGLGGIVADPFGSSLCLILAGLFFAKPLYRLNLLTIGDYFHKKYGSAVEILISICIVISYLGWVSAQIKALGLVFHVISNGDISQEWGMIFGASTVLIYTLVGGMWSVAITDFLQMIIIMVGMTYMGWEVSNMVGGAGHVIQHAVDNGKTAFWPKPEAREVLWFFAAWVTMMLGSIPQQDVFQRMSSAKNEKDASRSAVLGGGLYFLFAFIPIFLAYSASLIDPQLVDKYKDSDSQLILPNFIMHHMPIFAQVLFFGALLSAIKSCASATLLAPSVTFSENILKRFFKNITDHQFLTLMRVVVVLFTILVTVFALNTQSSIYKMVEDAYKITLVAAFVPLAFGVYWKKSTPQGGLFSVLLGLIAWVVFEIGSKDGFWPPQLVGLLMSILGMVVGSLLPQWIHAKDADPSLSQA